MRGKLIVLEGLDRSGKSSQCELATKRIAEFAPVDLVKFPDRTTTIGSTINSYLTSQLDLSDEAIHLLFAANRWELFKKMDTLLQQGTNLVVDRYVYSGAAFSAAKGLDLGWCTAPDQGLLVPDLVVFLDVSSQEAEKRGGYGEERYEKREFQAKVRSIFEKLRENDWVWIDASRDRETVFRDVWRAVSRCLDRP